jgi:hypothetical protein
MMDLGMRKKGFTLIDEREWKFIPTDRTFYNSRPIYLAYNPKLGVKQCMRLLGLRTYTVFNYVKDLFPSPVDAKKVRVGERYELCKRELFKETVLINNKTGTLMNNGTGSSMSDDASALMSDEEFYLEISQLFSAEYHLTC